jgi:hypothetical protein
MPQTLAVPFFGQTGFVSNNKDQSACSKGAALKTDAFSLSSPQYRREKHEKQGGGEADKLKFTGDCYTIPLRFPAENGAKEEFGAAVFHEIEVGGR